MKEKKEEIQEKYSWLKPNDERQHMSGREIIDTYVDLDKSGLIDSEKKQILDILYKYKMHSV